MELLAAIKATKSLTKYTVMFVGRKLFLFIYILIRFENVERSVFKLDIYYDRTPLVVFLLKLHLL